MEIVNTKNYYTDVAGQWWYKSPGTKPSWKQRATLITCAHCGNQSPKPISKLGGKTGDYCSRLCGTRASGGHRGRSAEKSHLWKGGKRKARGGYVEVYAPNHPSLRGTKRRYVREHRLVMEATLQRYLEPWEEVHHLNAIRDDNRPENLELWVKSHPAGARYYQAAKHCPSCSCSSNLG